MDIISIRLVEIILGWLLLGLSMVAAARYCVFLYRGINLGIIDISVTILIVLASILLIV